MTDSTDIGYQSRQKRTRRPSLTVSNTTQAHMASRIPIGTLSRHYSIGIREWLFATALWAHRSASREPKAARLPGRYAAKREGVFCSTPHACPMPTRCALPRLSRHHCLQRDGDLAFIGLKSTLPSAAALYELPKVGGVEPRIRLLVQGPKPASEGDKDGRCWALDTSVYRIVASFH